MASNPMQRKARNSFLLGVLLTLVLAGVVVAFLVMQLMNKVKEEQEAKKLLTKVYVLNQDVKSGQVVTEGMLVEKEVRSDMVPENATSAGSTYTISDFSLQDKEGHDVTYKNEKGNVALFLKLNDKDYELKQETTGEYYIERNNGKEYIELTHVPLVAKVDMKTNTIVTKDLITKGDNLVKNDVRQQEYNMIIMPMNLTTGDYVDIRIMLPSGQDLIVVSKKEVEVPTISGVDSPDTIWLNLTEDEILHMSCAIIDVYQIKGAKLYAAKYTEAGMQTAAIPTYPLNESTIQLLASDPNILDEAENEIAKRYADAKSIQLRNDYLNATIEAEEDSAKGNIESGMQESITNSKNNRKEYLDSLAGVVN